MGTEVISIDGKEPTVIVQFIDGYESVSIGMSDIQNIVTILGHKDNQALIKIADKDDYGQMAVEFFDKKNYEMAGKYAIAAIQRMLDGKPIKVGQLFQVILDNKVKAFEAYDAGIFSLVGVK